jgi:Beta-ketoacyl synthase, N-terminal domain
VTPLPAISIRRWAFWSAETEDAQAWLDHWSSPDPAPASQRPPAASVPAMQRRRLSKLSRMAVQLALDCSDGTEVGYTIFGSRHGEVVRTRGMLAAIAERETLSPTQFSQSVHNTSSGLFAILTQDHGPATSIAAGAATFAACWTEAVAELTAHPGRKVLLVCADEVLPEAYATSLPETQCDQAVALLLEAADGDDLAVRMQRTPGEFGVTRQPQQDLPMGPQMLAWWMGAAPALELSAEGDGYCWSRA